MNRRVSKGRAAAKTPARKTSRRSAKRRPADLETPLSSGAAVAVLDALAPEPDASPPAKLPRLVPGGSIERCTMEELLLMAIAGEMGDVFYDDPLEAIAVRLAEELEAISATTSLEADVTGDLLHHATGRARVLAELIRRAHN